MRAPARGGAGPAVGAEGPPPRAGAACRKDGVTRAAAGSRPPSAGRGQRSRSARRGEVSGRRGPGRCGARGLRAPCPPGGRSGRPGAAQPRGARLSAPARSSLPPGGMRRALGALRWVPSPVFFSPFDRCLYVCVGPFFLAASVVGIRSTAGLRHGGFRAGDVTVPSCSPVQNVQHNHTRRRWVYAPTLALFCIVR